MKSSPEENFKEPNNLDDRTTWGTSRDQSQNDTQDSNDLHSGSDRVHIVSKFLSVEDLVGILGLHTHNIHLRYRIDEAESRRGWGFYPMHFDRTEDDLDRGESWVSRVNINIDPGLASLICL